MQTLPNLNDQHAWRGQHFRVAQVTSPSSATAQECTPLPARGGLREDICPSHLPQGGVIASSSDNLFHPTSDVPLSYAYNLSNVPLNPHFHARNHSPFSRPLPYPSFTSYNNPTFTVPPLQHYNSPNRLPPLPHALPSEAPPPIPPHFHSHPAFHVPRSQFDHWQPAYIHSQPAFDHPLPQNHSLHLQLSLPPTSPSSLLPTIFSSKTLPMVTHIPILTSKNDFFPWDEGVQTLIHANGLIGHILDFCTCGS
jgi:hypothetical protein